MCVCTRFRFGSPLLYVDGEPRYLFALAAELAGRQSASPLFEGFMRSLLVTDRGNIAPAAAAEQLDEEKEENSSTSLTAVVEIR